MKTYKVKELYKNDFNRGVKYTEEDIMARFEEVIEDSQPIEELQQIEELVWNEVYERNEVNDFGKIDQIGIMREQNKKLNEVIRALNTLRANKGDE